MGDTKKRDPANRVRDSMTRDMAGGFVLREAEEGDGRVVELSFSSEEPCERWFGTEILSHDADAANLSRLLDIGTLLFNHDPDKPIGRILSAEIDEAGRRGVAKVRFDEDEASETIYQKVKGGSLKGVSVGYRIDTMESVKEGATSADGRFRGPCEIATKWTAYEISIVSVPADATVGVGRSENPVETGENGGMEMEQETRKQETKEIRAEEMTAAPKVDMDAQRAAVAEAEQRAVQAERARVEEISAMCRNFDISPDEYIKGGMTVEAARAAVMDQLAAKQKPVQVTITADEGEKFRAAAVDGLAIRAGVGVEKPAAGAENFRGKSLLRLAAECLERDGMTGVKGMQDEELVRAAMTGTGAFPGILSNDGAVVPDGPDDVPALDGARHEHRLQRGDALSSQRGRRAGEDDRVGRISARGGHGGRGKDRRSHLRALLLHHAQGDHQRRHGRAFPHSGAVRRGGTARHQQARL